MIMRPCTKCSFRNDCEKREGIRAAVKGIWLTTISFPCKKRTEHLPPGGRVSAEFTVVDMAAIDERDGSPIGIEDEIRVSGTIIRHKDRKVIVWLDENLSPGRKHPIVRLWPDRLTVLDEPSKILCEECGKPDGEENSKGWHCSTCNS